MKGNNLGSYQSFGIERGTEILRYKRPDGSLSGIIFKFEGGLLTANHVVEAHKLQGFKRSHGIDFDISCCLDEKYEGLRLGYIDRIIVGDVDMVTSSVEEPDDLVIIPGITGVYDLPTILSPFCPNSPDRASKYFKPGASGSPLIYKDYIVGLVPFQILNDPYEVAAVVFNSSLVKKNMERFGLTLEEID